MQLDGELMARREREYVTLARVRIAQGTPVDALRVVERLLPAAEAAGRVGSVIELLLLHAVALQALRRPDSAPTRPLSVRSYSPRRRAISAP